MGNPKSVVKTLWRFDFFFLQISGTTGPQWRSFCYFQNNGKIESSILWLNTVLGIDLRGYSKMAICIWSTEYWCCWMQRSPKGNANIEKMPENCSWWLKTCTGKNNWLSCMKKMFCMWISRLLAPKQKHRAASRWLQWQNWMNSTSNCCSIHEIVQIRPLAYYVY